MMKVSEIDSNVEYIFSMFVEETGNTYHTMRIFLSAVLIFVNILFYKLGNSVGFQPGK